LIPEARKQVIDFLSYFKPTQPLISENVAKTEITNGHNFNFSVGRGRVNQKINTDFVAYT